ARRKVARFINAPEPETVIFVKNATEAINLVAYSWARNDLAEGDEILVSPIAHHSNLEPWQLTAQATDARRRFFDGTDDGRRRTHRAPLQPGAVAAGGQGHRRPAALLRGHRGRAHPHRQPG